MLSEDDLQKIKSIVENTINNKIEEIKANQRHIHNDVENIRRDQFISYDRFTNLSFALSNKLRFDDDVIEQIIHTSPYSHIEVDRIYSPIDDIDKADWERHINEEKYMNDEN